MKRPYSLFVLGFFFLPLQIDGGTTCYGPYSYICNDPAVPYVTSCPRGNCGTGVAGEGAPLDHAPTRGNGGREPGAGAANSQVAHGSDFLAAGFEVPIGFLSSDARNSNRWGGGDVFDDAVAGLPEVGLGEGVPVIADGAGQKLGGNGRGGEQACRAQAEKVVGHQRLSIRTGVERFLGLHCASMYYFLAA